MIIYEYMNNYSYKSSEENIMKNIDIPTEDMIIELADIFKLFADSSRIKILYTMIGEKLCVCDIAEKVTMTHSAVSHQLKTLKQARLVKSEKRGKEVYYSLDDEHIEKILNVVL